MRYLQKIGKEFYEFDPCGMPHGNTYWNKAIVEDREELVLEKYLDINIPKKYLKIIEESKLANYTLISVAEVNSKKPYIENNILIKNLDEYFESAIVQIISNELEEKIIGKRKKHIPTATYFGQLFSQAESGKRVDIARDFFYRCIKEPPKKFLSEDTKYGSHLNPDKFYAGFSRLFKSETDSILSTKIIIGISMDVYKIKELIPESYKIINMKAIE